MSKFKVGQTVTCINDSGFTRPYKETVPVRGKAYMIRAVLGGGQCLRLVQIINTPHAYADGIVECAFKASRFKAGR